MRKVIPSPGERFRGSRLRPQIVDLLELRYPSPLQLCSWNTCSMEKDGESVFIGGPALGILVCFAPNPHWVSIVKIARVGVDLFDLVRLFSY